MVGHALAPVHAATVAGDISARARLAAAGIPFVGDVEFAVGTPLGRDPTRIIESAITKVGVDAGVVVEHLSLPGLTIIVAIDNHTIAPGVVHDESKAVVFGGLHPVAHIGTPVATIFFAEEGDDDVFLVPVNAVAGAEVVERVASVAVVGGKHVDDFTVGAGSHHDRPRRLVVVVKAKGARDGSLKVDQFVFVLNEVDAAFGGGVGGNDDSVFLVAGDGAEAGLLSLDATTHRNPFVSVRIVGADTGTTVSVGSIACDSVGEIHFAVGPHDGAVDDTAVGLPVVGRVVELAVFAEHVRLALDEVETFHASGHLHGGGALLDVLVGHLLHLRVTGDGHQQDEC